MSSVRYLLAPLPAALVECGQQPVWSVQSEYPRHEARCAALWVVPVPHSFRSAHSNFAPSKLKSSMYASLDPLARHGSLLGAARLLSCTRRNMRGKPTGGSREARGVTAQMVEFKARRSVSIACREGRYSVDEYLSEADRIVHVAFPDKKRRQRLGNGNWRIRLRPVSFFSISATPVCDLRAWYEAGALRIFSSKVVLDMAGLPSEMQNIRLLLSLDGELHSNRKPLHGERGATKDGVNGGVPCTLEGWVNLGLKVDIPLPFSLLPESAICGVGDAILDGILAAMQGALLGGLVSDYKFWLRSRDLEEREAGRGLNVAPVGASSA